MTAERSDLMTAKPYGAKLHGMETFAASCQMPAGY